MCLSALYVKEGKSGHLRISGDRIFYGVDAAEGEKNSSAVSVKYFMAGVTHFCL